MLRRRRYPCAKDDGGEALHMHDELKWFLEKIPPGKSMIVNEILEDLYDDFWVRTPELELYCEGSRCEGERTFVSGSKIKIHKRDEQERDIFLHYKCRNCSSIYKTFAVHMESQVSLSKWRLEKYGEIPPFGPPTPPRVVTLVRNEKELFSLGRRCEHQGMGIGAFVYYRRVIESQRNRIFDEVIRVTEKISPKDVVLEELKAAKEENQFTTSVERIKHDLPQTLFINGYNPLTLLHGALSKGVHGLNDAQCLELASDVRNVLFEFTEKLAQALKDDAVLNESVKRLAKKSEG
jgi:hypothetical protein